MTLLDEGSYTLVGAVGFLILAPKILVPQGIAGIRTGDLITGSATGTGSEVMSRIAAPMVGGMVSSTVLTLAVIPAIYALVKEWGLRRA
ncbi:MAG: Cation efflux system protein CusA [Candidatus Accumulibacter sp. SK-11]|nr:MAG: Cation efflux system protein CusA [Candidatus Accumulibacter sp. SK-11]